jgi:hypothetical protein
MLYSANRPVWPLARTGFDGGGRAATEIEDRLGIIVEDEDVDGDMLSDYGSLLEFVSARRKAA